MKVNLKTLAATLACRKRRSVARSVATRRQRDHAQARHRGRAAEWATSPIRWHAGWQPAGPTRWGHDLSVPRNRIRRQSLGRSHCRTLRSLGEHGMDLSIIPVLPEKELETYRRVIDGRRVDALIVSWTRVDDDRIKLLQSSAFPFLAYGRTTSRIPYPWFDFDNEAGAKGRGRAPDQFRAPTYRPHPRAPRVQLCCPATCRLPCRTARRRHRA